MSTQPGPLTRKQLLSLPPAELAKIVSDPVKLAEANAILNSPEEEEVVPPVVVDEDAALAAKAAEDEAARVSAEAAAKVEADKATAKAAEQEAYKAAGVTVDTDANGNITKIVKTYQARDDAGNPIGRATYLEAKSWLELSIKQQAAHENAVRFAERVKKQAAKVTVKKEDPNQPKALSEDELLQLQEELKGEDREKAAQAAEKVRANDETKRLLDADKAIEDARQAKCSFEFLTRHINDYKRCEANNKMLTDYIHDNQLEWNQDNLELAFIALQSQFAPLEQPAPPAPVNPPAAVPAVVTPPPVAAAPPAPPAAPNPPAPPAPRPGVNGGLVPGQQSAARPTGQPPGLTKADIKNMSRDEYRRRLKDPKFVSEVNALLARK